MSAERIAELEHLVNAETDRADTTAQQLDEALDLIRDLKAERDGFLAALEKISNIAGDAT